LRQWRKYKAFIDDGYRGVLLASRRPCNRKECKPCTVDGAHALCETSKYTKCQSIQLSPKSTLEVSPTVGGLAEAGRAIGSAATAGELLVGETDSDETPWWLLKVTGAQQQVPAD